VHVSPKEPEEALRPCELADVPYGRERRSRIAPGYHLRSRARQDRCRTAHAGPRLAMRKLRLRHQQQSADQDTCPVPSMQWHRLQSGQSLVIRLSGAHPSLDHVALMGRHQAGSRRGLENAKETQEERERRRYSKQHQLPLTWATIIDHPGGRRSRSPQADARFRLIHARVNAWTNHFR